MTDNNLVNIVVGDTVKHRHRGYPKGKIVKLLNGCNAICWVDFGEKVLNKPHLTICVSTDIVKTDNV